MKKPPTMPEPVIGPNGVETKASRAARDRVSAVRKAAGESSSERKPLFAPEERLRLRDRGYSEEDVAKIVRLTRALVESQVLKGEVDPDNPADLKDAVKIAGRQALSAYNAALEYLSG